MPKEFGFNFGSPDRQPIEPPGGKSLASDSPSLLPTVGSAAELASAKFLTKKLADPILGYTGETDGTTLYDTAITCGVLRTETHEVFWRTPAENLGDVIGLSDVTKEVVGSVAQELPLFGDSTLRKIRKGICVLGMISGFAAANPHVFLMCFKVFAHDKVVDYTKKAIHETLFGPPQAPKLDLPQQVARNSPYVQDLTRMKHQVPVRQMKPRRSWGLYEPPNKRDERGRGLSY